MNEELKQKWALINARLDKLEAATAAESRRVIKQHVRTAQQDLAGMYKRFAIFGGVFSVVGPMIMFRLSDDFINPWFPSWLIAALFFPYFACACIMDTWLYFRTKEIDVGRWSLDEVSKAAVLIRKRHHQFMIALIPYMVVLLTLMILCALDGVLIAGIICGAVIGLLLGLRLYRRMMADLQSMIDPEDGY